MPLILYFNPRSYKRSDCARKSDQVLSVISIHAPTRGATDSCRLCVWIDIISIHAPTRGATSGKASGFYAKTFQSTLLQEERRLWQQILPRWMDYFNPRSYKRSDYNHGGKVLARTNFNPRSYKRSDSESVDGNAEAMIFQSTLLQEERLNWNEVWFYQKNFNPRSYKRSDPMTRKIICGRFDFNPRSYKRSDQRH